MRKIILGIAMLTVALILGSGKAEAQTPPLTPEQIADLKVRIDDSVQRMAQLEQDSIISRSQTDYLLKQQKLDAAKQELGQSLLKFPEIKQINDQLQQIAEMERDAAQSLYRGQQRGNLADYQRKQAEIKQMKQDVNDAIRALPRSLPVAITQDTLRLGLGGIGFQQVDQVQPGDVATAVNVVATADLGIKQIGTLDKDGVRSATKADYDSKQQDSNKTVSQFQRDLALKLELLRTAQNNAERSRMHPGSPNP